MYMNGAGIGLVGILAISRTNIIRNAKIKEQSIILAAQNLEIYEWFVAGPGSLSLTHVVRATASGTSRSFSTTIQVFGCPGANPWTLLTFYPFFLSPAEGGPIFFCPYLSRLLSQPPVILPISLSLSATS